MLENNSHQIRIFLKKNCKLNILIVRSFFSLNFKRYQIYSSQQQLSTFIICHQVGLISQFRAPAEHLGWGHRASHHGEPVLTNEDPHATIEENKEARLRLHNRFKHPHPKCKTKTFHFLFVRSCQKLPERLILDFPSYHFHRIEPGSAAESFQHSVRSTEFQK